MHQSSTTALVESLVEIAARHSAPRSADSEGTLRSELEQVLHRDYHDEDDFTAADVNLLLAKLCAAEERAKTEPKVLGFEDQSSRCVVWVGEGFFAGICAMPYVLLGLAALAWFLSHQVFTRPGDHGPWSLWCLLVLVGTVLVLVVSLAIAACRAYLFPPRWKVVRTPYGVESLLVRRETGQFGEMSPKELVTSTSLLGRLFGLHWIKIPNIRCRFRVSMLQDAPSIPPEARKGGHDVRRTIREIVTVLALVLVGCYSLTRQLSTSFRQAFSWEEGSLLFAVSLIVACVGMGWLLGALLSREGSA